MFFNKTRCARSMTSPPRDESMMENLLSDGKNFHTVTPLLSIHSDSARSSSSFSPSSYSQERRRVRRCRSSNRLGINPYLSKRHLKEVKAFCHAVAILICGAMYVNWVSLGPYLERQGLYSWFCTEPTTENNIDVNPMETCVEQREALARLPIYATSSSFIFAIFGGAIRDRFGYRTAYLVAAFSIATSVFGIGAVYSLAKDVHRPTLSWDPLPLLFVLWGSANEILVLGLIGVQYDFPGQEATLVSCLAAARSFSLAAPSLLSWFDPPLVAWTIGYAAAVAAYAILFAFSPFFSLGLPDVPSKLGHIASDVGSSPMKMYTPHSGYDEDCSPVRGATGSLAKKFLDVALKDPKFAALSVYYGTFCLGFTYSSASLPTLLAGHPRMLTIIGTLIPLSGAFGAPTIGWCCDRYGSLAMPSAEAIAIIITLVTTSMPNNTTSLVLLAFASLALYACRNSQVYVVVCANFPQEVHGLLIGFTFLVGGCAALLSGPLMSHLLVTSPIQVNTMIVLLNVAAFAQFMGAFIPKRMVNDALKTPTMVA